MCISMSYDVTATASNTSVDLLYPSLTAFVIATLSAQVDNGYTQLSTQHPTCVYKKKLDSAYNNYTCLFCLCVCVCMCV